MHIKKKIFEVNKDIKVFESQYKPINLNEIDISKLCCFSEFENLKISNHIK